MAHVCSEIQGYKDVMSRSPTLEPDSPALCRRVLVFLNLQTHALHQSITPLPTLVGLMGTSLFLYGVCGLDFYKFFCSKGRDFLIIRRPHQVPTIRRSLPLDPHSDPIASPGRGYYSTASIKHP